MIEGLTAIYGINTQAKFQFRNYADSNNFTNAVSACGCFAHALGGYTVLVLGPMDNVELLALAYKKNLLK